MIAGVFPLGRCRMQAALQERPEDTDPGLMLLFERMDVFHEVGL